MCYPPNVGSNALYVNAKEQYWNDWEYGTTVNLAFGSGEERAIRVTYNDDWREFILFRSDSMLWNTEKMKALVFRVKGVQNTCAQQLWIHLREQDGTDHVHVPVTDYMVTPESVVTETCWNTPNESVGHYDPDKWYIVVIPFSSLVNYSPAEPLFIKEVVFEGGHMTGQTVYLDDIWWVEGLDFPLKRSGDGPYTTSISSVFDHVSSMSEFNCRDEWVVAYTGEVGHSNNGESPIFSTPATGASCHGDILRGYKNGASTKFNLHGQYSDSPSNEDGYYLFYDGHTGYDFPAPNGTGVYSVATGNVISSSGDEIVIDHGNGYESYYLHLSLRSVGSGTRVSVGTKIGEVGDEHLHYTLKLYGMRVDPYGWEGSFDDPSRPFAVNINLWK